MTFAEALRLGRYDIPLFAREVLGIEVHPGQQRFFDAIIARAGSAPWRAAYLTICAATGNRAGKTLAMAIAILHSCFYKMNMRPPDDWNDEAQVRMWMRAPYDWYHFGIQQEVAELVYQDMVRILESRHDAQKGRECPLIAELGPEVVKFDRKFRGEYPWIVFSELVGGAEIHFRSTTEKALGSLGKAMHGVSMDECGFENNLPFIVNEVFQMRRLSTGGQLFLISTPSEGFTAFTDEWLKGDPENPLRKSGHYSLRWSTRDNVGYGIDASMFDALLASMPKELIPQNIDGHFLQGTKSFFNSGAVDACFIEDMEDQPLPLNGSTYIQGIDPALTYDATVSIVLNCDNLDHIRGASIARLQGKQTTVNVVGLAHEKHAAYNANGATCVTGLDVTGFGGKMMRDAMSGIEGLRGVEFGGTAKNKLKLLMDLKAIIEQGRIKFPRHGLWLVLRRQLLAYRLRDRNMEQDAVMALAVAVKLSLRLPRGGAAAAVDFKYFEPEAPKPTTPEGKFWDSLRRRATVQRMETL